MKSRQSGNTTRIFTRLILQEINNTVPTFLPSESYQFQIQLSDALPYSYKFWRGFNLAMDQNDFFGVDLIWRWTNNF